MISYIMVGYPSQEATLAAVRGLLSGGADIIELGFPFSDPLADGPVIQNASMVSLENGMGIDKFLSIVKKIREETEIPLVLMTYTNILYRRGFSQFIKDAKEAGIDGFILPDMSIEESEEYLMAADNCADTIFLISPNTSRARIDKIAKASSGFLYVVAVLGTTGVMKRTKRQALEVIRKAKEQTNGEIPVGVGFGISRPQDVKEYVSAGVDAVIVGSAYMRLIEKGGAQKEQIESMVAEFTEQLKKETIL